LETISHVLYFCEWIGDLCDPHREKQ